MRFAYADPPYLGQGKRYAHLHPEAHIWDDPDTHRALADRLDAEYPDGWAASLCPQPIEALIAYLGPGRRLAVWHRPGSEGPPTRITLNFELVVYRTAVPNKRGAAAHTSNVFRLGGENWQLAGERGTHTGTKPEPFCHWVLDLLGYDPEEDAIDDLFPGEGSMTRAAAQHTLNLWTPDQKKRVRSWHPGGTEKLALCTNSGATGHPARKPTMADKARLIDGQEAP